MAVLNLYKLLEIRYNQSNFTQDSSSSVLWTVINERWRS